MMASTFNFSASECAAGLPKWAQGSPSSVDAGSMTPGSLSTTATQASVVTQGYLAMRRGGRTDTQSTNGSIRWAPQALCRSWHGKLAERYSTVTIVGEGRSGAVFIVQHKETKNYYACKVLNKGDHHPEALRSEVQTMRRLDHPNIVRLLETHEDGDTLFLLMELCQGGDLFDKIVDEQQVMEPIARHFARQMISALAYCHANGVIHRDVKPENFLLETDHSDCLTIKLADFGIATSIRPPHLLHSNGDTTTPGSKWASARGGTAAADSAFGSLPYTAPEILRGRPPQAASDMWSVGVTIYVMLCGSLPYDDVPERICNEEPDFSGEAWNDVSQDAIRLVRKLLKKNPAERLTAQQALAEPWLADLSPLGQATPGDGSSDGVASGDEGECCQRLATVVLKSLRRWRKMPKLRRIAIAAMAKRLEASHDAHRLAETVYSFFSDTPDTLRCDRLVQVLVDVLGGACPAFGFGSPPVVAGPPPGMVITPTALDAPGSISTAMDSAVVAPPRGYRRSASGGSLTGLRVRERLMNSLRRLAGACAEGGMVEEPSPEAQATTSELNELVAALDGMNSGDVDFTLLVAALLPAEVFGDEQRARDVFSVFDVQRRNRVSGGDVRAAIKSQDTDVKKFAAMVAQFDTNGDGALDFAEFYAMTAGLQ